MPPWINRLFPDYQLWLLLVAYLNLYTALPSILHTSISCDKSDFLLKIAFNETFNGLIYTEQGSPNCVYVNASIQPNSNYQVKIPLAGCETRRNSDGNLENEIVIQNGDSFRAGADRKFLLTCIPAAPRFRDSLVTVSFGGVTIDQATTASSLSGSQKLAYSVTVIDATKPGRSPLKRPLAVGDKVIYSVFVSHPTNARIGRCWATDGSSNLELSDRDGCSLQRSGDVWNDFRITENDTGITYENSIKAWAFPTSNEVNIFCNLHVCASCKQTQCATRRRRGLTADNSIENPLQPLEYRLIGDQVMDDDLAPPIPLLGTLRLRRGSSTIPEADPRREADPRPEAAAQKSVSSRNFLILSLFSIFLLNQ
ncbi:unnamed protein product, partial [Mesorhabditis belari]|uniref:ZP domain-containing protein n=1 Tax=Mesorhabditis belari TaxID=2138241 RepID=A0AAF3FEC9_9BILA